MKFSSREDINVPAAVVFAAVSDFQSFERMMMHRGADVVRLDNMKQKGAGMAWDLAFRFRGRDRKAKVTLKEFTQPKSMVFVSDSSGIDADLVVQVTALSPTKSRLMVSADLKPKTLSARLLVQSMKLAKSTLNDRFKSRISNYAGTIEQNHASAAA